MTEHDNQQSNPGITVIKYSVTLMTEHDNQQSNPGITAIKLLSSIF
jgi:hypothetical protein